MICALLVKDGSWFSDCVLLPLCFLWLGGDRGERGERRGRRTDKNKKKSCGFKCLLSMQALPKVREDAYVSPTLIGRVCAGDYTTVRRLESVPMQ